MSSAAGVARALDDLPVSRFHYKLLVIHGFGWMFDAMDVGLVTFVLAALAGDWHLRPSQIGMIGSAGLLGMLFGALISGRVADKWGRRAVFQTTLLVFSCATLMSALAWNLSSMIVFRFIVGIGLGGELPVVATLLTEFVPKDVRGKFLVLLESFWALGWLVAAVIAYFLIPKYGWRIGLGIGAVPALYVWVIRRKLPESPRWLALRGRLDEARAVLAQLGDRTASRQDNESLQTELTASAESKANLFKLLLTRYRKHSLMAGTLWFGMIFAYYGIFVWLPTLLVRSGYSLVKSFLYVLIVTLFQLPGYFSAAFLIDRVGRKKVIAFYLLSSAIAATLFGYATHTSQILVWGSLMSLFNLGAWGAVYAYTPELYPTFLRGTGMGSAAAVGRFGGFLAPLIVGFLLPYAGKPGVLVVNAALLVLAAAAVLIAGPETKGMVLD